MELTIIENLLIILKNQGKINNKEINQIMDFSLCNVEDITKDKKELILSNFINFS